MAHPIISSRRTTSYTVEIPGADWPRVDRATVRLTERGKLLEASVVREKHGSLTFRAVDDETAEQIADHVMQGDAYTLRVGLGIHRRVICTKGA